MSAMVTFLMLAGALASVAASDRSAASVDAGALGLTIAPPEDRWFLENEDIPFRVTIANKTDDELAVCFENSQVQKKLITFRLYDDSGKEVTSDPSLHVDYGVTLEQDTVLLPPLGEHVGTVRLQREYLPRVVGACRKFSVVAVYHCPFDNEEVIGGRRIHVAAGVLTSSPVTLKIDSRSWLKRTFGSECR